MQTQTIWNGTPAQAQQLCDILKRHCACGSNSTHDPEPCGPHDMLLSDQRALDGLLFARHIVTRLVDEEFLGR
jgi:hypothetical protein